MTPETINRLKLLVSEHTGCINIEKLNKKGTKMLRKHEMVFARQLIMYFLKAKTRMNLYDIGDVFLIKLDHANIIHGIKTIENLYQTNKLVRKSISAFILEAEELLFSSHSEEDEVAEQIESYFII